MKFKFVLFVCGILFSILRAQGTRITGGDGVVFNFNGRIDRDYCLVTDPNVHVNAHVVGLEKKDHVFTWVNGLGIMTRKLDLYLGARQEESWDTFLDHLEIKLNGKEVFVPAPGHKAGPLAKPGVLESEEDGIKITRQRVNEARVEVYGFLDINVVVNAVEQELRTTTNCFPHLNVEFLKLNVSNLVHGVLGQTFRPRRLSNAQKRFSQNQEEISSLDMAVLSHSETPAIAGETSDYLTSGLWAPDCQFSKYRLQSTKDTVDSDNIIDIIGQGITLRRKGGKREGEPNEEFLEEVNPLESYFTEEAVRVVGKSSLLDDVEVETALTKFEEGSQKRRKEGVVIAVSDSVAGISHSDSNAVSILDLSEAVMTE